MIKSEYRKILFEVFDVLGFFEYEKERALEGFKRKFANEILQEFEKILSAEHRQWLADVVTSKQYDKNHPNVSKIQRTIDNHYPKEKLDNLSRQVFKKVLFSYINFMNQKIDLEKSEKLSKILGNL